MPRALQSALLGLSESAAILKLFYRLSFGVLCSGVECFNFRGWGLGLGEERSGLLL